MKLSIMAGYSPASMSINMEQILEAERLGYDCVWTAEAYGSDAVSPAAWVLAQTTKIKAGTAIMQMPARAPAMTAMTAMTLSGLSGGRFVLGLGPSGPQVVEGWYGVPYGKPLTRTREYIRIIRDILAREGPLTHEGEHYTIPNTGPGTTGQGKALKSILHGDPSLPVDGGPLRLQSDENAHDQPDHQQEGGGKDRHQQIGPAFQRVEPRHRLELVHMHRGEVLQ